MTVTMIKNRVELALAEQFDAVAGKLPGGGAVAEARRAALTRFAEVGLPHRRIEEWKYTDLRNVLKEPLAPALGGAGAVSAGDVTAALGPLAAVEGPRAVFVDGVFRADLSRLDAVKGLDVMGLAKALASAPDQSAADLVGSAQAGEDGVLALNTAYVSDGAVVRVRAKTKLAQPLLLVFVQASGEPRLTTTRNVVSVGEEAQAVIVEAHVWAPGAAANGQTNAATEVIVGARATVSHVKLVVGDGQGTHLCNWMATIEAQAVYRGFQLTAGTGLARNSISAKFHGTHAKLDLSGVFLGRGGDHIDTTLIVDHAVPHCVSRELFKGVLDGHARGIFQGKVIVRPDAQKSDGKQMAQALMLSSDAEFDSKPELEIYADDVVCGHGSTAAELDEDLLFYLMARGIPRAEARALLIESFVGEAIDQVEHEGLREALIVVAKQWLGEAK